MRELTSLDLTAAVSLMRSTADDPLTALISSKRVRVRAMQSTVKAPEAELRVLECFAKIRSDWSTLPCRRKIRHVLGHGVAFSPGELAAITGHKVNSVISTLARMRARGEVTHEGHGRWVGRPLLERVA